MKHRMKQKTEHAAHVASEGPSAAEGYGGRVESWFGDRLGPASTQSEEGRGGSLREFPFRRTFDLAPLEEAAGASFPREDGGLPDALRRPLEDLSDLDGHKAALRRVFEHVIPAAISEQEIAAVSGPFHYKVIHATNPFKSLLANAIGNTERFRDTELVDESEVRHAYALILERYYGVAARERAGFLLPVRDPETGLERWYRIHEDCSFCRIEVVGELPQFDQTEWDALMEGLSDLATLSRMIPADRFVFRGFVTLHAMEVTTPVVSARINERLLNARGFDGGAELFESIRRDVGTLIEKSDVSAFVVVRASEEMLLYRLGAGVPMPASDGEGADSSPSAGAGPDRQAGNGGTGADTGAGGILSAGGGGGNGHAAGDFPDEFLEESWSTGRAVLRRRWEASAHPGPLARSLQNAGVGSFAVLPLFQEDRAVGALCVASPSSGGIDGFDVAQLNRLQSLFAVTAERTLTRYRNRIEQIILEQCTTLHPTVEWRFWKAAVHLLQARRSRSDAAMEEIVFPNVYPLYGISDVRGSSLVRNRAAASDLKEQLEQARCIVVAAHAAQPMPILEETRFRIDEQLARVEESVDANEEIELSRFLREEVEIHFPDLEAISDSVRREIAGYREACRNPARAFYRSRQAFDESMHTVNATIASILESAQPAAQRMYPHYFDKTTTDGVDHSLYIGATLLGRDELNTLYVRNLRLWQLLVMCRIARAAERLTSRLPVGLETTHLIVVQHSPITVTFRYDERRLGVSGAYNIRYEIMKKRIDKATVRETGERLSVPDRIAIVYSQEAERLEYERYLRFLICRGWLEEEIERCELNDLQGVSGLSALRVRPAAGADAGEDEDPLVALLCERGADELMQG